MNAPLSGRGPQESPVGKAGRVVTPTRGTEGPGEVELEIRGGLELFIARSPEPLAKGTAVLCVSTLGPRSVIVLPWLDPKDSLLDLGERG
jgi:hypothetical protein